MRSREHSTRRHGSWKTRSCVGRLQFCWRLRVSPTQLAPLAPGDELQGSTGLPWAEPPGVCARGPAVGEAPLKSALPSDGAAFTLEQSQPVTAAAAHRRTWYTLLFRKLRLQLCRGQAFCPSAFEFTQPLPWHCSNTSLGAAAPPATVDRCLC